MSVRIFTGNSNPELARSICEYLGIDLGNARVGRFSDGEIRIEIEESVRGDDVYVIQSTCAPVNDNLMELLLCTPSPGRRKFTPPLASPPPSFSASSALRYSFNWARMVPFSASSGVATSRYWPAYRGSSSRRTFLD